MTVLFADAVGSTPLAEKLGEEDMYALMREALSRMAAAIHAYEGHVATFTGDGMMALFGAPIAHEDSARRGVAAALRMQSSLEEYGTEIVRRYGVECRFRVGLNTGPVVVGTVTDDLRMDVTAIGDTVNLAARMEQVADPGSVFVSEGTHRTVADFFECEDVGDLALKGKVEPVRGWRVIREKGVRTRFQAAAERDLSPLVGRDRELALLAGYVEASCQGGGRVVSVSGEAGIGKSRLILELRRRVEGVRWLEGRCVSYGRNSPYLPVLDLLKAVFGVTEGDDEGRIISRVDEVISGWDEDARRRVPYLKYLLSVDPDDQAVLTMDPQERRVEIFEALGALLVEETRRRPLVVAVEDLHWADQMSVDALSSLMTVVPTIPVLLLLTHRPDYEPPSDQAAALKLEHLDDQHSAALTRGVLGAESLPAEINQLITAKAEGNPFYIEEVSKALVEAGVVERVDDTYRLRRRIDQVQVPGTIQDVILSRIDRLERDAKEAMQLASVVGREFTARVLDRISELEAQLSDVLDHLSALELIYEKARFPELAYMFKHALIHDVAYATLLTDRRRALHRLVGAAVEELYADRLAEHYEMLAHHFSEGQDWHKALEYLEKAGDKAAAAYANADALGFYALALDVCDVVGDEAVPRTASLAAKRGFINFAMGDLSAAITDFDRMLAAARRLGSRSLEGTALGYRGFMEVFNNQWERAEATLRSGWAIVEDGCEDVRPLVSYVLAFLLYTSNRLPEAVPLLISADDAAALPDPFLQGLWINDLGLFQYWWGRPREALTILQGLSDAAAQMVGNRLWNHWSLALALATTGDYTAALELLHQTQTTCERVGDTLVRPRVLNTMGWILGELEDHQRAAELNRSSAEMADVAGFPNPDVEMHARVNLGDNLMSLGQFEQAEEQFRMAEAVARSPRPADRWMAWRYSQHLFHSYGELCLARGELERALAYADACLELAEYNSSTKNMVKGRRLRAQVFIAQGRLEDAEEELLGILEVADRVGNPPQRWKTHAAIGELRRAQGRPEDARVAYANAWSIIEGVAGSLEEDQLRETFLQSPHVLGIRRAAENQFRTSQPSRVPQRRDSGPFPPGPLHTAR